MSNKNSPTFLELLLSIVFGFLGCILKEATSSRKNSRIKNHTKGR